MKSNIPIEEEAFYIDLIKRRDGLMVRQMYQFIEPDTDGKKITEGTFNQHLKRALRGKGARMFHPVKKSRSQFYSFRSHLTQNRQFLMVMLAELELLNKKEITWYYPEMDLYESYIYMIEHIERPVDKLEFERAIQWHKNLANDTKNRKTKKEIREADEAFQEEEKRMREDVDALEKACEEIHSLPTVDELVAARSESFDGNDYSNIHKSYRPISQPGATLKRPELMKEPEPVISKPVNAKLEKEQEPEEVKPAKKKVEGYYPDVPLRTLYLRGIFIEPQLDENGYIDHWVFHWFDNNNLYDFKFQENYMTIVRWLISMKYIPSWEIVIYA